jgi:hypothetical protein
MFVFFEGLLAQVDDGASVYNNCFVISAVLKKKSTKTCFGIILLCFI